MKNAAAADAMNEEWVIEPARRNDAEGIVSAIRAGFDPNALQMFIYGCSGIENYVADQIEAGWLGGDHSYTVCRHEGHVIGCVEMRLLPNKLFLNYISVLPQYRTRGLAKDLLKSAVNQARASHCTEMQLDVFQNNAAPRSWYDHLGFSHRETIVWLSGEPPEPKPPAEFVVTGASQALRLHKAYGFSEVRVLTSNGSYSIGRLGDAWFRLTQAAALDDPGLGAALSLLGMRRRILILLPENDVPLALAAGFREVVRSSRMSVDLATLCGALGINGDR